MSVTVTIPTPSEYREVVLTAGEADYIVLWKRVDNYLYGLTNGSPAKLLKIGKDNFEDRTTVTFASDGLHRNAVGLVYAPATGVLYALFAGDELVITEVTLDTLTITDKVVDPILTVFSGGECLATDDTYLFVLFKEEGTEPTSKIKRYVLADLRVDNVTTLALPRCGDALVVAGPLYVIKLIGTTPKLLRIAVEDFAQATFDFPAGTSVEDGDLLAVTSSHLFVSFREVTGKLYRFNLATLALDVITTGVASNHAGLIFDGIHLWDLLENGTAIRIDPATLEQRAYAVNPGEGYINEIAGDGVYLYASFFQVGTKIARYYISHTLPTGPQLVGFLPAVGVANDVVVSGDFAFLATETFGLAIVDISDPDVPTLVSTVDRPFNGSKLFLSGPIACVTGRRIFHSSPGISTSVGVFYIINITDPSNPWLMGSIEDTGYFHGVSISGNYAYVGRDLDGVAVIDINNKALPVIVGSYDTPGGGLGAAVVGTNAYVADGQSGLRILDVSNPAAPTNVGSIGTPGSAQDVTVVGSLAYVADAHDLQIVDVSNPAAPSLRGGLAIASNDIKLQSNTAYVASGSSGLKSVNVSNPDSPSQVGSIAAFGANSPLTGGVFTEGSLAYLANGDGGLGIANISNPATMTQVSSLRTWFAGTKITIKPGLAVLTGTSFSNGGLSGVGGLRLINIADPSAPTIIGSLDDASGFFGVATSGNYVYAACGFAGVKVIDISNPALPVIVGSYDTPGGAQAVSVVGNYAYVTDGFQGLRILDISNPALPLSVGTVDTQGNARHISVVGSYAYVADFNYLQIIDVSNPASPATVGSLIITAMGVEVANGIAYVAAASALTAVDVSNPAAPRVLGSMGATGSFNPTTASVSISSSTAYVANGAGGLAIIDVSNPASLRLLKTAPTLGYTSSIAIAGQWVYLADSLAGINIFEVP